MKLEASKFVTLDEESGHFDFEPGEGIASWAAGSFVRLRPPASASPERVEAWRKTLVAAGASAVRVESPRAARVVPEASVAGQATGQTIRGAAMQLVEEAQTRDRGALREVVEDALARVGL